MSTPRVIISGASIAGLSAAFWLSRVGWDVTVIERADSFRDGGQNVDIRGVAHDVLDRMGLVDAIKARNTTETGTIIVDADGRTVATLPSDDSDGATAELEVLRGDFAKVLLDALPDDIQFLYGQSIDTVDDFTDGPVRVGTSAGESLAADLLVIAEGVRSFTRDLVFGRDTDVDVRDFGVTMVFGTIPRVPTDDDTWRWYNAVRGRQIHLRPDPYGTTRAILAFAGDDKLIGRDRDDVKKRLRSRYADAGWQASRVLDGFEDSPDVYMDELTQIRMRSWRRGRVAILGDAAWCVTPMGGGGASLALTAGYILAANLHKLGDGIHDRGRLDAALQDVDDWLRPLVDNVQKIPKAMISFAYPQTRVGLASRRLADRILLSKPLKPIAARFTHIADTDQPLPELDI